jgi:hypothetical protein
MLDGSPPTGSPCAIGVTHRRRLREVYRSAGWPCQDAVEIELLAAGLLVRERDADGTRGTGRRRAVEHGEPRSESRTLPRFGGSAPASKLGFGSPHSLRNATP